MFRYEIPYIQYAVFKTYIAKNLCVNKDKPKSCCEGKCFREKQLQTVAETSGSENKKDNNQPKIPENKEVKEFILVQSIIPKAAEIAFSYAVTPGIIILSRYIPVIFVPPKQ